MTVKATLEYVGTTHLMKAVRTISPLGPIVLVVLIWEVLAKTDIIPKTIISPPTEILGSFLSSFVMQRLPRELLVSLGRVFVGYFASLLVAVPFGLLLGWKHWLNKFFEPIIEVMRPIPSIALVAPAIIFFGIGDLSKISIVFYATFFIVVINCLYGVYSVDSLLILSFRSMYAKERDIFFKLIVPASLPSIIAGMRLAINVALIVVVGAEMILASSGIGYFILDAQQTFHFERMYVGIIALSITGYSLNKAILAIENRVLWWASEHGRAAGISRIAPVPKLLQSHSINNA